MADANVGISLGIKGADQVEAGFRRAATAAKGFNKDASGVSSALKSLAGYAAGFFGAYKVLDFLASSTKDAIQADAAVALLQARLQKVGITYSEVKPKVDDFSNSLIKLGRSDEETAAAVGNLVTKTKNLDSAIRLTKLASDLAASGIGTYSDNVDNLSKILIGRGERALIAFGVKLQTGATIAEQLAAVQKKVTRTTEQWADTTEGQVAKMSTSWGELKESIGNVLVPSVTSAIGILNQLLNIGNKNDSRSDWTKAVGLSLDAGFKRAAVLSKEYYSYMFGGLTGGGKNPLEKVKESFEAIKNVFKSTDDQAEKSMAAILKGTTDASKGLQNTNSDFSDLVDDASSGATKLQDAFRDVAKSVADSVDEQTKAIANIRKEMKGLDSDLQDQLAKAKDRQKEEMVNMARQSEDKLKTLNKEIADTTATQDKGWRTKVEQLQQEKAKEQAIIARIGGQITNINEEVAKDDLTVLQEQHAKEIQEIKDQAERKKLELQKEELERQKFILEQAVAMKQKGYFSTAISQAGTFLGSIGQDRSQQSIIFNFNGDVSDIDRLKKVIIDALNREATLRGVGGK